MPLVLQGIGESFVPGSSNSSSSSSEQQQQQHAVGNNREVLLRAGFEV
jgi:hypothetical protein